MVNKKENAREEWLRIVLRTREKSVDLQKQIRVSFASVISSQNTF
jgi:hypothetical protein